MPAVAQNGGATVELDGQGQGVTTTGALALNLAAGTNTELVVLITFSANVSAISGTYGAKSIVVVPSGPTNGTNCGWTYAYHVSAPATGAQSLTINWTTSSDFVIGINSFDNAAGGVTHYNGATGTVSPGSVTITTSGTNDAAVAMFQNTHTSTFNSTGQTGTQFCQRSSFSINASANYLIGPSASQAMQNPMSANDNWVAVGVAVLNLAAAAGNVPYDPWPQWAPILAQ